MPNMIVEGEYTPEMVASYTGFITAITDTCYLGNEAALKAALYHEAGRRGLKFMYAVRIKWCRPVPHDMESWAFFRRLGQMQDAMNGAFSG